MSQLRPHHAARSQPHARPGSVYVLVLGVAMLLTVIGLSAAALVRIETVAVVDQRDWAEAGMLAESGIEHALGAINDDPDWRTTGCDYLCKTPALGHGRLAWELIDEVDGDIANNTTDPVRIRAIGAVGRARRVFSVQAVPQGSAGADVLGAALYSSLTLTTSGTVRAATCPFATASGLTNNGTLAADVEAYAVTNLGNIQGTVTAPAPTKTMPLSPVATYSALATLISYASTGGSMDQIVLSAGNNPYGVSNARGLYKITVGTGQTLSIRHSRIAASLLVTVNTGGTLLVRDEVMWDPPADTAALIVNARSGSFVTISGAGSKLNEASEGVNFNPPSTPYAGASDSDTSDTYPTGFRGVYYVIGAAATVTISSGASFSGCFLSDSPISITDSSFTGDSTLLTKPPMGFYASQREMRAAAGTWTWDTLP